MASLVKIDSVEVTIARKSLLVDQRIEERSIAEFTVLDRTAANHYQKGQPVEIYDPNATLVFGGVIDTPDERREGAGLIHHIACADYHYLADKRIAAESYEDTLAGTIVADLRTKYLADEGITVGEIQDGPTIKQAVVNYVRVSEAFDALAEKANFVWYIDELKKLYFIDRATNAALWTADIDDPTCFIRDSVSLSKGNPLYRNRQYIRGGRALTDEQTENRTGDGNQKSFVVGFPIAKVPTIKENTVEKSVGIKGLDTGKDWYWSKGDIVLTAEVAPADGVAIQFIYTGEFNIIALSSDEAGIIDRQDVEGGGTGYVDDIAEDTDASSLEAAFQTAAKKLQKFGVMGRKFTYQTHRSGLKPGQLQPVNYPPLNLNNAEMLIEAVKIRAEGKLLTYEVTAIEGPEMGSWSRLFQQLAEARKTAIDKLNVGEESILIILVEKSEEWGWQESVDVTVFACPVPSTTLYPQTTLYPC